MDAGLLLIDSKGIETHKWQTSCHIPKLGLHAIMRFGLDSSAHSDFLSARLLVLAYAGLSSEVQVKSVGQRQEGLLDHNWLEVL